MKQTLAAMIDLRKSIDDVFRNGYTVKMAIGKVAYDLIYERKTDKGL